ncbi:hypothetical protein EYZ11_000701 [Aspergillus tanneri]|nr:hypothetical protein EYZ11_000701 [Aspergillus tanneri]
MAQELFYGFSHPPPRVRTKPLQVICVGLPRSATESLSMALQKLGYTTFHGWDLVAEEGTYIQGWNKLAARKYGPASKDGSRSISATEFDALLGHCDVVIDSAASLFSAELVVAYPDAKVILNSRRDLAAWQRSVIKTIVPIQESWFLWTMRWFESDLWWLWQFYMVHGYPGLFRATYDGSIREAIQHQWVYRDHCSMARGMVPKDRLLEWTVEEGWEPLCKFLGKPVPDEPFPRTNDASGFEKNVDNLLKKRIMRGLRNMGLLLTAGGAVVTAMVMMG